MKRILITFIILAIIFSSFSFPHLKTVSSENIQLPSGWSFSTDYQKIPVTFKGIIYYAYQIEKKENNQNTIGWLIVDSNNKAVTERSTYENLALAATVSKYTVKLNELKYMEDLDKNLKDIKWIIDLYEIEMSLLESLSSFIGTIKGNIPSGLMEESTGMIISVSQSQVISTSDRFLNDFTTWVGNNVTTLLANTGELTRDLSDASALKAFGVIKLVMRKGAYISFKKGFDQFEQALNILNSHNGAWSYEDASNFLTNYEQGEARSIAYGSWYLDLIPSSKWEWLWDNVFKQVLSEWVANPVDFGVKFKDWLPKATKTNNPDAFGYKKVIEDITSIESSFMLYKSFYDTSLKDSIANKTFFEITKTSSKVISNSTWSLSITSNPLGAKVYINGTYKGVTPIKIELKKGSYTVKLSKDGYKEYTTSVTMNKSNQLNINLTKIPKKSILHVYTVPAGANIYLNDKLIGKSPLYFYQIDVGTYKIHISKEGYLDYFGEVKILPDKNNIVNVELRIID
jgi:hypothetical protein